MEQQNEQANQEIVKKKLQKFKCCFITCLVAAIVLIVTSAFTPYLVDSGVIYIAKQSSQLTAKNEKDWKDIPGHNDIGIYWDQYFYNCTNAHEVIYMQHKPEFKEFGPYKYQEYDNYTNL